VECGNSIAHVVPSFQHDGFSPAFTEVAFSVRTKVTTLKSSPFADNEPISATGVSAALVIAVPFTV
jgi:hypothetical protein